LQCFGDETVPEMENSIRFGEVERFEDLVVGGDGVGVGPVGSEVGEEVGQ
jgi:hypothetical protein